MSLLSLRFPSMGIGRFTRIERPTTYRAILLTHLLTALFYFSDVGSTYRLRTFHVWLYADSFYSIRSTRSAWKSTNWAYLLFVPFPRQTERRFEYTWNCGRVEQNIVERMEHCVTNVESIGCYEDKISTTFPTSVTRRIESQDPRMSNDANAIRYVSELSCVVEGEAVADDVTE